jgi:hypothetical protein
MELYLKNNTDFTISVDDFEIDGRTYVELDDNDLAGILTDNLKDLLLSGDLVLSNNKELFAANFANWFSVNKLTTKTQFRPPVLDRTQLITFGSERGDVCITLDNGGLYWFTGTKWETLVSSSYINYDGSNQADNITKMVFVSPETQIYTDYGTLTTYVGVPKEPIGLQNLDLTIINQQYTGRVSQGNFHLKHGVMPGSIINNIISTDNPLVITTPENVSGGDKGQIKLKLNGAVVASIDLDANYVDGLIEQNINNYNVTGSGSPINKGSASFSYGTFNVEYVKQYQNFFLYKTWKAKVTINDFATLRTGYSYIEIVHELDIITNDVPRHEVRTSNICEFFIDRRTQAIQVTDFTMETNEPEYKYLSGVRYYDTGTIWKLKTKIAGAFNLTYPTNEIPLTLNGWPGMTNMNIPLNSMNVQKPPFYEDVIDLTNTVVEQEGNAFSANARIAINVNNIYGKQQKYFSNSDNIHVCSFSGSSTDLSEKFYEELYRFPKADYDTIPTGVSGKWDSNQPINIIGRTSWYGLQVFPGKLIYPTKNFVNGMLPTGNPNYTNLHGDLSYYRAFKGTKISRSQGTLRITGISAADLLSNKIKVEIKLPAQTGWLLLNNDYNYTSFKGQDGNGCWINRLDQNNSDFQFTLDKYRTEGSNFILIVKITMKEEYKFEITRLEITDW